MLWLKLHTNVSRNRKAQSLPGELFKFWINCLCLAKENGGYLPPLSDLEWELRIPGRKIASLIDDLRGRDLLEESGDALKPHEWEEWQARDKSTDRVRKHRYEKRQGNADETLDETKCNTSGNADETLDETKCNGYKSKSKSKSKSREEEIESCPTDAASFLEFHENGRDSSKVPTDAWFKEQHERWWPHYWNRVGKQKSLEAFRKRVPIIAKRENISFLSAVDFLIEQAKMYKTRWGNEKEWEWMANLNPATWTNNERWTDEKPNRGDTSSNVPRPLM